MISIIVPIYNSAKYLDECINSILNQTYSDFEVLLIDDGSTDNSMKIIKAFSENDSRVRAFYQENAGPSCTRNYGIKKAKGDYVVFIDSDDIIDKDYLKHFVNSNQLYGPDSFIITRLVRFADSNSIIGLCQNGETDCVELKRGEEYRIYFDMLLNSPCNKFYHRNDIEQFGVEFEKDICIGEDLLFNIKYIRCAKPKKYIILPQYSYFYRVSADTSLTKKYISDFLELSKHQMDELILMLEESKASSVDIKRARMSKAEYCWRSLDYYYDRMPGTRIEKIRKCQEIIDNENLSQIIRDGLLDNVVGSKDRWICRTNSFVAIKGWFWLKKLVKGLMNNG